MFHYCTTEGNKNAFVILLSVIVGRHVWYTNNAQERVLSKFVSEITTVENVFCEDKSEYRESRQRKKYSFILELQPYIFFCVVFQKEQNPLNFTICSQKKLFEWSMYEKLHSPCSRLQLEGTREFCKLIQLNL